MTGSRAGRPSPHPARRGSRDKAYSSPGNRAHVRKRRITAVIPERKGQGGRPVGHDAGLYKERNTVERLIDKLKARRGIATRYDRTPESHLAGLHLRGPLTWMKDLARPQ